jgi:signal recognition particle GTPase
MTITEEDLKKAVDEAVEKATKGLKEKNTELLGDLKKEKDARKELDEAKRIAEEEAANKSGDVEKIKKQLEDKHKRDLETISEKANKAESRLNQVLIDNGLTEALIKAKIAPQFLEMAKDHIKARNTPEIGEVDGNPTAFIGGKAIDAFITEWSQGDNGKHFIAAPANGGGGSNGSNSQGKAQTGNADMGGDKAARTAAIAQKFPNLSDK